MHHTQNEPNFEYGNESTDLDEPRCECVGVPDVLIVSCLYLEIIVNGVVRHVHSPSRAVPIPLSESYLIGNQLFIGLEPYGVVLLI